MKIIEKLKNMKIQKQVRILAFAPVVAFMFHAGQHMIKEYGHYQHTKEIQSLLHLSVKIGNLLQHGSNF